MIENEIVWLNPTAQSIQYCRPLHIQYRKETVELITKEQKWTQDQIVTLSTHTVSTVKGLTITVKFKMYLTCIDG